jgi:hypothetical protein
MQIRICKIVKHNAEIAKCRAVIAECNAEIAKCNAEIAKRRCLAERWGWLIGSFSFHGSSEKLILLTIDKTS